MKDEFLRVNDQIDSENAMRDAKRALTAAKSARFWLEGRIHGVVNTIENGTGGQELISFTDDPELMVGAIWPTLFLEPDGTDYGDWGLPSLSAALNSPHELPSDPAGAFIFPPDLPSGDTVGSNIVASLNELRKEADLLGDPRVLTGEVIPIRKFFWFFDHVRTGGDWDYKNVDHQFDYAGNFNYGATGAALRIPIDLLLRGAGLNRLAGGGVAPRQNGEAHWGLGLMATRPKSN
ncbi:MAG: hypothetical protein QOE96_1614 [Blastocatellia bacterium]|jgi:hypothetical protein|nr:hypothetical protein [Blastocatellia bacterium]